METLEKNIEFFKKIQEVSKKLRIKWNESDDDYFFEIPKSLFENPEKIYNKKGVEGKDKIKSEEKYYINPRLVSLNDKDIFGMLYIEVVRRKVIIQNYGKEGERIYKEDFSQRYKIKKELLENC
ncbi:MAG: hypothetical protein QXL88_02075 [Candidatus Pacearchaeota archaeon]